MATFTVLGAGMMGSALCVPLADGGHDVRLVGTHLDEAIIGELKRSHTHPKLGVQLAETITPYSIGELEAAMDGTEIIALGVSSAGIGWATEQLAPHVSVDRPLFMITKGLDWDGDRLQVLPDVVRDGLPQALGDRVQPAAVAGPCIAGELARRVPSCVVLAGRDATVLDRIAGLIGTDYYHLWTSTDVVGCETCAALKNAYAMAIAFGEGMHEQRGGAAGSVAMHNLESAIFAQSVVEMGLIVAALGGQTSGALALAGVGDLDVTTNGGRTGRFGRLLGRGLSLTEAIARMEGATLECLEIIAVMRAATQRMAKRGEIDADGLPLLNHLAEVVLDGAPVAVPLGRFFGG
jgi:glycerol-3-phosphate dehydrogenase (NAD(P)+)